MASRPIYDKLFEIARESVQNEKDPCERFGLKRSMQSYEYAQTLAEANYAIAIEYCAIMASMSSEAAKEYLDKLCKTWKGKKAKEWDANQKIILETFMRRIALSYVAILPPK